MAATTVREYPPETKAHGRDIYLAWRAGDLRPEAGEPKKVARYIAHRLGISVAAAYNWCNQWGHDPEVAAVVEQRRQGLDDEAYSMAREAARVARTIMLDREESGKVRVDAARTVIGHLSVRAKARADAAKVSQNESGGAVRSAVNIEIVYPDDVKDSE